MRIALIAHDAKKADMVAFCQANIGLLSQCELIATGTTGKLITEHTGLKIQKDALGAVRRGPADRRDDRKR